MEEIIIKVWKSEEGFMYSIYEGDDAYVECDDVDGGLCATTMSNALDMATAQAKDVIRTLEARHNDTASRNYKAL